MWLDGKKQKTKQHSKYNPKPQEPYVDHQKEMERILNINVTGWLMQLEKQGFSVINEEEEEEEVTTTQILELLVKHAIPIQLKTVQ